MARIYVALGSNLGDRAARIYAGVQGCVEHGLRCIALSRLYETEPVGGPPQPAYLNAAAGFESGLEPGVVLAILQAVEEREGRVRSERFAARTLDLDLLMHGSEVRGEERLVLPHPRLHERLFVLEPLASIAPDVIVPGFGRTVAQLLEALRSPRP